MFFSPSAVAAMAADDVPFTGNEIARRKALNPSADALDHADKFMPVLPQVIADQLRSVPTPSGLTMPRPVTTTRLMFLSFGYRRPDIKMTPILSKEKGSF